jgi:hypothetical protein
MPGGADSPRRELDAWQDWAKARGAKGLAYILVAADGTLGGPVAKNLSEKEAAGIVAHVGAKTGDAIFFAAGDRISSLNLLGAVRLEIGKRCNLIDNKAWNFLWIVDAPMFEQIDSAVENSGWTAVHHPFTGPKPEFADTFDKDPASALAYAYDIVLNGNEIGGGSIRIHDRKMQARVFETIGLSKAEAESKKLQGQGIADQRREIAKGLVESVEVLNKVGINSQEASALIVITQHYDTLQAIGADTNSNLILLPNSPQAASDMLNNMVTSFTASNIIGEEMKRQPRKVKKTGNHSSLEYNPSDTSNPEGPAN